MSSHQDINDQSAQNWKSLNTSNIENVKLLAKNPGKPTNIELFNSIKLLMTNAVTTLYGTAGDDKYKKIVNLIMSRIGTRIESINDLLDETNSNTLGTLEATITNGVNSVLSLNKNILTDNKQISNSNLSQLKELALTIDSILANYKNELSLKIDDTNILITKDNANTQAAINDIDALNSELTESRDRSDLQEKIPEVDLNKNDKEQTSQDADSKNTKSISDKTETNSTEINASTAKLLLTSIDNAQENISSINSQITTLVDKIDLLLISFTDTKTIEKLLNSLSTTMNGDQSYDKLLDTLSALTLDVDLINILLKANSKLSSTVDTEIELLDANTSDGTNAETLNLINDKLSTITTVISDQLLNTEIKQLDDITANMDNINGKLNSLSTNISTPPVAKPVTTLSPKLLKKEKKSVDNLVTALFKKTHNAVKLSKNMMGDFFSSFTKKIDKTIDKHGKSGFSIKKLLTVGLLLLPLLIPQVRSFIFSMLGTVFSWIWSGLLKIPFVRDLTEAVKTFVGFVTKPFEWFTGAIVLIKNLIVDFVFPFLKNMIVNKISRAWDAITGFSTEIWGWLKSLVWKSEAESNSKIEENINEIDSAGKSSYQSLTKLVNDLNKVFDDMCKKQNLEFDKKADDALKKTELMSSNATKSNATALDLITSNMNTMQNLITASTTESLNQIDSSLTELNKTTSDVNSSLTSRVDGEIEKANLSIKENNEITKQQVDAQLNDLDNKYKKEGAPVPVTGDAKKVLEDPEVKSGTSDMDSGKVTTDMKDASTEIVESDGEQRLYVADKEFKTEAGANAAIEQLDSVLKNMLDDKDDADSTEVDMANGNKSVVINKTLPKFTFKIVNSSNSSEDDSETSDDGTPNLNQFIETFSITDDTLDYLRESIVSRCEYIESFLGDLTSYIKSDAKAKSEETEQEKDVKNNTVVLPVPLNNNTNTAAMENA